MKPMSLEAILGPDGAIARGLHNYEYRPQQMQMAQAVEHAIACRSHLMVEAGTGVGKTFAYLVPAIQAAIGDPDCRVVISTNTISLQEQLIQKDIPFLQSVLPPFRSVLVKGRSNYISMRRLRVAWQHAGNLFGEDGAIEQLHQIGQWANHTKDGSRSDLDFEPRPSVWSQIESDSNICLGRKCPTYASCFYFKARRQMQEAHLLVVNHALLFRDLALRRTGSDFGLLPKYRVAILDEGHTLEDIAAQHFGLQVSSTQLEYLLNRLFSPRTQRGLLVFHGTGEAMRQVSQTRLAAEQFFAAVLGWISRHTPTNGRQQFAAFADTMFRVREPASVPDMLSEELKKLASCLDTIAAKVKREEEQIELKAAAERSGTLAVALEQWLSQQLAGQVYWIEKRGKPARIPTVTLACAPIEVGSALRRQLYEQVPTVVLTSATLSTGGPRGFDHFRARLGLEVCTALQLGSPFNYREQAELHLFRDLPDPTRAEAAYEDAIAAQIQHYVERTHGRAFVLFTSHLMLRRLADRLREWLSQRNFVLLAQGDGLPRQKMLERFRAAGNAVLFGVDSFWQGVDVQGEALSNVIITKLPFPAPGQPINEARMEAITASGGNAFLEYLLPQAVIKLKQGFGRLIRTRRDRGLVVLLDPRVLTKPYGEVFLHALPDCHRFVDGVTIGANRSPNESCGPKTVLPKRPPQLATRGPDSDHQDETARSPAIKTPAPQLEKAKSQVSPDKNLAARVHALGESSSAEHVPELIRALDDDNGNVRRLAASALGKLRARAAVESLLALLQRKKGPQVRLYAIKALGKIGDPRARQLLERIHADAWEIGYNRVAAGIALRSLQGCRFD
jgi:ATP-dependent DNA helicase DinG